MKIRFPFKQPVALMLGVAATIMASASVAQDKNEESQQIQIVVQQDGAKVNGVAIPVIPTPPQKRIGIQSKDGKIVFVDASGKKHEVDIQGATSVTIDQEMSSTDKDGEKASRFSGKAIIIDANGVRQEIVLGSPIEGSAPFVSGWQGVFQADRVDNKFMIGVYCQPVGDSLRAQLDLEDGAGLVVVTVNDDSAATKAGIEMHDILMAAGDTQFSTQSDLVKLVQLAGKEKAEISMTVIRRGKEITVAVTPVERPEVEVWSGGGSPRMMHVFPNLKGKNFSFKLKKLEPGVIFSGDFDNKFSTEMKMDFDVQLKEMQEQMEALQKQMQKMHDK